MIKNMEKFKKNRIISVASISSIAVGIILIVLGMAFYKLQISRLGITESTTYQEYKYHFAIVTENGDAEYWNEIYQGALEKGKNKNAYVEKLGSNLSISYSLADLMRIAIASKVHGIILEPNGDENVTELINEANAKGIPVVTVLKDILPSDTKKTAVNRISFVGINNYNLEQEYAKQVAEVIKEGRKNIMVLMNDNSSDMGQTMIYSSIHKMTESHKVNVESATVNSKSAFSSVEDIRNIIMNNNNPPDVLVCLNEVDTLGAYQVVRDYNKVGDIDIIGYYDSEIILRAIEMNIVHSTMTFDAHEMGVNCVEALSEYITTKNVSDYYPVYISVINMRNVKDYLEKEELEATQEAEK